MEIEEEIKINKEESTKDLEKVYKFVYTCDICGIRYGSDKEEKGVHLCPICEKKQKEKPKKNSKK